MLRIDHQFDAGSIEIVSLANAANIRLKLRPDMGVQGAAEFSQWFYFCLQGAASQSCQLTIENASTSAYPAGWEGYHAVASYDRQSWFRLTDTQYVNGNLVVRVTPESDALYIAYFQPYSWERHLDLVARMDAHPLVEMTILGATVDGRSMHLLRVGRDLPGRRKVWVIARQHPGETMAEWLIEGLLERLTNDADPVARNLLDRACVYVVPNMNPDGSVRGNLRTNAAGTNLNREWMTPSAERSPEVLLVRQAMEQYGVDLFLDIHGDETLPYVFIDGSDMVPGLPEAVVKQQAAFLETLCQVSPDFQTEQGYARDRFDDELLTLASKWVAHRFGCLSLTLEMPFKDNANMPDGVYGWSAARSQCLGAALLQPVLAHVST